MKIANLLLEKVHDAVKDAGKNRLPYEDTERLYDFRVLIADCIKRREGLRTDFIKQYDETGKGWEFSVEAPPALVESIQRLLLETVDLDFGPPLVIGDKKAFLLSGESLTVLKGIGIL